MVAALASVDVSRFVERCRPWAWSHEVVVGLIASESDAPEELILDFDATDDAVHGRQVERFFHGYYHTVSPLHVSAASACDSLRPSKIDGAKHAWAILARWSKGSAIVARCAARLSRG